MSGYVVALNCGHLTTVSALPPLAQIAWCPTCASYVGMIVSKVKS